MTERIVGTDEHEGHWYTGEEIVRCRDCVYYNDGIKNGRRYAEPHCLAIGELAYGALFGITEDDYCSWGERKEGSE